MMATMMAFLFHRQIPYPKLLVKGEGTMDLGEIVCEGAHVRGRQPGTKTMTKVRGSESPWFYVVVNTKCEVKHPP